MKREMIAIYTLTSELHDEKAVGAVTQEFLSTLGIDYTLKGNDYADYGNHALSVIYVRTGGTEGIFRRLLPQLRQQQAQCFMAEGELVRNQAKPDLCRTQQIIQLSDAAQTSYFLTRPIGNHHIITPDNNRRLFEDFIF